MRPDIFEVIMLICFGSAWPFSIYKMLKTKKSHGKSIGFLVIILIGYISGVLFQYYGERNAVIILYLVNVALVATDLCLTIKYSKHEISAA